MDKINNLKLWCIFFFYTFCVSAFVQFVLLPYVFPGLHAGSGLLICSFDSIGFHKLALESANKIHAQGWSAWQLKPEGHVVSGIASIFYVFLPNARILIPLNAALHASAALVLVNLLDLFINNKFKSILCALPFLVFPSNLQWTAQLHKDIFSVLGVVMLLYGLVSLVKLASNKAVSWFSISFYSIIFCICGFILLWLVRSYMLMIVMPFVISFFSILFLVLFIRAFKKDISWHKTALILLDMLFILLISAQLHPADLKKSVVSAQFHAEKSSVQNISSTIESPIVVEADAGTIIEKNNIDMCWKRSSWLPLFIDRNACHLAIIRRGFRGSAPEARSNIDCDIGFGNAKDMLIYLPRAAQIAFLAPFPTQWFSEGTYRGSYLMRRVASYEMMVVYFALLFLPCAIWRWRKRAEIWTIFAFCVYMMLIYGLTISNIGTLYRMRYPYITTLVALGIAGFTVFLDSLKIKKKQKAE
ncbi:MAG: hypothetical protein Q8R38_05995 [Candidatus Omnitrophota bacterium]|nr:hypothetical protein [Candidatus Omnitrophota bacterium]